MSVIVVPKRNYSVPVQMHLQKGRVFLHWGSLSQFVPSGSAVAPTSIGIQLYVLPRLFTKVHVPKVCKQ